MSNRILKLINRGLTRHLEDACKTDCSNIWGGTCHCMWHFFTSGGRTRNPGQDESGRNGTYSVTVWRWNGYVFLYRSSVMLEDGQDGMDSSSLTPGSARQVCIQRHPSHGFGFIAGSERPVVVRSVFAGRTSVCQELSARRLLYIWASIKRDSLSASTLPKSTGLFKFLDLFHMGVYLGILYF